MPRVPVLRVSPGLHLPPETVTSTLIVYGGKGMGKTNLLGVVLEEMSDAGLRWCSIDPIGVHWGLRHAADGRGRGVECLILGGVHGDMPITPASGEIVADLVADEHVNVIIDCSRNASGAMWSIGERTRFITAFALRLFQRQGSLVDGARREPIFLALDEAARYVPQTIPHGNPDLSKSLGAWEQLVEEGRNVGIGVGLFTQRSARLNKSVAELADTMIAFRTTGPNSINAIIDWLGEHVPKADQRTMIEQVRKLPVGTALVVSPGWLGVEEIVAFRARATFDSSATPKPGERARRVTGSGATVDLASYEQRMAAIVEEANASNPSKLRSALHNAEQERARLAVDLDAARLKAEEGDGMLLALSDALGRRIGWTESIAAIAELAAAPEPVVGLPDGAVALLQAAQAAGAVMKQHADEMLSMLSKALVDSGEAKVAAKRRVPQSAPVRPQSAPREAQSAPREAQSASTGSTGDASLGGSPLAILTVMVEAGIPLTDRVIAARAGVSRKKSTFRNAVSTLRSKGYVTGPTTNLEVTQAGIDALGASYEPLPSGRALVEHWKARLGESAKRMFQVMLDHYPEHVDHETIAALADVDRNKSTYRNAMSELRGYDLVSTTRDYASVASEIGQAWLSR